MSQYTKLLNKKILQIFILNLLPLSSLGSTTLDVYGCPLGFSGPDCSVPYEECPDGRRKCFNNSNCVRNNKLDPVTNDYQWHCDCSNASSHSSYAGHECEHSATITCEPTSTGTHFCTNGGECGKFFFEGNVYTGCHCPDDFEGAHCQYLLGTMDGDLFGEEFMADVGDNFYAFKVKSPTNGIATEIVFGITVFSILSVMVIVGITVHKNYEKEKQAKEIMMNLKLRQYTQGDGQKNDIYDFLNVSDDSGTNSSMSDDSGSPRVV